MIGGRLCASDGTPVMLRGISTNELISAESYVSDETFGEFSRKYGANLVRLAVYTYGVGVIGYCTKGDRARYNADIEKGVEFAKANDMYVIIDWHILSDGDPNTHTDEAVGFFADISEKYASYENVIYEICNEPNGVGWQEIKAYAEQVIPAIRENAPDSLIIVGTPDWSKDLLSASEDPLGFENVMYALHFYSATHKDEVRAAASAAIKAGLPVFVSEYGITASSGDLPRDTESAEKWIALLEEEHISYCMWELARAPEACSVIRTPVSKTSGFAEEDFTETGRWFIENLKKHNGR